MKKKNVLMMALSLALVAVIAVGGTLAYLTSNTQVMTNTFTFGTLQVTQREEGENGSSATDGGSLNYTNLLPNDPQKKDVKISLTNTASGVPAYVIVAVKGGVGSGFPTGAEFNWDDSVNNLNWLEVTSAVKDALEDAQSEIVIPTDMRLFAYATEGAVATPTNFNDVTLFDEIKVAASSDAQFNGDAFANATVTPIQVSSFAIQAENVTPDQAYVEAAKHFVSTVQWGA